MLAALNRGNFMSQERLQRRLAAILFADVVGYSRLTGQDEVGTWHRLQSVLRDVVQPHLKAHAGRIVSIKGDGILVEFASAVEALLARSRYSKPWRGGTQRSRKRIASNYASALTSATSSPVTAMSTGKEST
jgi:class 3 adenylate cyclase